LKKDCPDICMLVCNGVTQDPRVRKEAESLAAHGYSIFVLGFKFNSDEYIEEVFPPGYKVIRTGLFRLTIILKKLNAYLLSGTPGKVKKAAAACVKSTLRLYQIICILLKSLTVKANAYHAHDLDALPSAYLASLRFKGKLVYDSHELYTEQREDTPRLFKLVLQGLERFLIKKAGGVITVNHSIARELTNRYNIPPPLVLRNFMKKTTFEVSVATDIVHDKEIKVLYHGGFLKGRGIEEVIRSVAYWDESVNLYLRGFGPIEDELRQQVSGLNLENRIFFLDPVPMERLIIDAVFADIGILPYKPTCLNNLYSLPNKLFEYMMAGLAVAASDLPEIRRLNEEVGFGLLFDPDSPESIAGAVNGLARDKAFLHICRENARAWSITTGNWETESSELLGFYKNILSVKDKNTLREDINEAKG